MFGDMVPQAWKDTALFERFDVSLEVNISHSGTLQTREPGLGLISETKDEHNY